MVKELLIEVERMHFPENMIIISMNTKTFDTHVTKILDKPTIYVWKKRRYCITSDNMVFEELISGDEV